MVIVGERLHSSHKRVAEAIKNRDVGFIQREAKAQVEAGANFLDVNAAMSLEREPEDLQWLVEVTQKAVEAPLCIDSTNPEAIEAALKVHQDRPLLNSITGEKKSLENILPLVEKYHPKVVALTMDDEGIPQSIEKRVAVAQRLTEILEQAGIRREEIFVDPLVCPLGTETQNGTIVLETIRKIKESLEEVKTICGLSNISFGLPNRKLLNRTFLVMALCAGLDAAILDPLDKRLMASLIASLALLNQDEYCFNYLQAFRAGKLET